MSFWPARLVADDYSYELVNIVLRLVALFGAKRLRYGLRRNRELKDRHVGQRCFVVGNGPSIAEQDLRPLAREVCFFVNRGFLHPDYALIRPAYHLFVDPKLQTGVWPLSFLDEAYARNPDVTFLLNALWCRDAKFSLVREKYRVYWLHAMLFCLPWTRRKLDLTRLSVGGGVVEQGVLSAIYMGCKKIYFTGVEGTILCYEGLKRQTHFYGTNIEDQHRSMDNLSLSYYATCLWLRRWRDLVAYAKLHGVEVFNCTRGGLLDVCPRVELEALF